MTMDYAPESTIASTGTPSTKTFKILDQLPSIRHWNFLDPTAAALLADVSVIAITVCVAVMALQ